jgi:hypothetical protein
MMRFVLETEGGYFFFDTLPDMLNSLALVDKFKPFTEDCQFNAKAKNGDDEPIDLLVVGVKFSDHITFMLSDESRGLLDRSMAVAQTV